MAFIEGKRIYLRNVAMSDVNENYYRWMNDPEVTQYLETRFRPQSMESIAGFVADMDASGDNLFLAICLRENDKHIGNIKLGPINKTHGFADISLLIGEKDCWGKGYASEAIGLLKDFAFKVLGLHRLCASAYDMNQGSVNAFLKNGFEQEGRCREKWYFNGKYCDDIELSCINELL